MFRKLLMIVVLGTTLTGCSLPFVKVDDQGALQVTSNLAASVFLDEIHVGQAPYFSEELKTGEYTLRLVPSGNPDAEWQSKIVISKRVLTVVNFEFGQGEESSSYEILQLEPLIDKEATELSISTLPDNLVVKLDGELKGFSPSVFEGVGVGDHTISLEAPGFKSKTINAKVNEGHRLKLVVKLAADGLVETANASQSAQANTAENESQPTTSTDPFTASPTPSPSAKASPSPSPSPSPKPSTDGVINGSSSTSGFSGSYVKILEAQVGVDWLRVHSEAAGGSANEVAKVRVGTYFEFVEKTDDGWSKIVYKPGNEGWVATRYTQFFE